MGKSFDMNIANFVLLVVVLILVVVCCVKKPTEGFEGGECGHCERKKNKWQDRAKSLEKKVDALRNLVEIKSRDNYESCTKEMEQNVLPPSKQEDLLHATCSLITGG